MNANVSNMLDELSEFQVSHEVYQVVPQVSVGLRPNRIGDSICITKIASSLKGEGYGSEALATICRLADVHRVDLYLIVEGFGCEGLSEKALADWYWRHGFRGDQSEMVREPEQRKGE